MFNVLTGLVEETDRSRCISASRTSARYRSTPSPGPVSPAPSRTCACSRTSRCGRTWRSPRSSHGASGGDRATIGVDALLADAGLTAEADRRSGTLDYGNQRRLELARAAALAPEFLLLDEPTSGMSDAESLAMVDHVRSTAAKLGAGVLVIDHDLGFISRICDHVIVLAEGRVLAEGTPDEIRRNPDVAAAYLGSRADPGQPAT